MSTNPESPRPASPAKHRKLRLLLAALAVWAVAAYLIAPEIWEKYTKRHPGFADVPGITHTGDGHPGDPINLAIEGDDSQLVRAMTRAGWFPADPITFKSSVRIAVDSVFRKPDEDAPVSNLYLFGRKQDFAFEQPVGNSPRQRHHVRFWRWDQLEDGRPVWFGSATYDERVGLSHTTGQVTHHIGPDVDAERDRIMRELKQAGWVQSERYVDGYHKQLEGRNGGGDLWRTDGRLGVVVLQTNSIVSDAPAAPLPKQ